MIEKINAKQNGAYFGIVWATQPKMLRAGAGHIVTKVVEATVRKGITYGNIKGVECKTHELPWGEWDDKYPRLVINYNGGKYVRLYTTPNSPKVRYFLDSQEISLAELSAMKIVSKAGLKNPDVCLTIKLDNILEVK